MPPDLDAGADLDLRLVRYFVAVARTRHFGRAADELLIAQPALSRHIQRLERQLGVRLLDRTSHGAELTEAGRVFQARAERLLQAADQATHAARGAGRRRTMTIGYTANLIVTPAVRRLRRRHADLEVRATHLAWNEPRDALLRHRVDAAVLRLPIPSEGLDVRILYEVPRVLVMPVSHRLAGRASVTLEDFAAEPLPRVPDEAWNAFWRIDPRPDGRPAPDGPFVETFEDKLELVAAGEAVCVAAQSPPESPLRSDLVAVPIDGVEASTVALATRSGDRGLPFATLAELLADRRDLARASTDARPVLDRSAGRP